MSDRLKLSDLKADPAADEVAKELILKDQLDEKIRELERSNAELRAQITKEKLAQAAPKKGAANKIGARKEGSFKAISTAPSINKTPIGPSMVPIPYPTTQDLSNSIDTARAVNFNGCPAYVLDGSKQPRCTGDEPGTGKGVKSGTVSGEVNPVQGSGTVRIEGKKVVRDGDACTMNRGNNPGIYVTLAVPSPAPPNALASNPDLKKAESKNYLAFKKWLFRTAFNVGEAIEHPSDAIHGAAKGIANIPSHLSELLLRGAAEQFAGELDQAAAMEVLLGRAGSAQEMSDIATAYRNAGARINLPKFKMRNPAEEGGDTISTIAQVIAGGFGISKSAVRVLSKVKPGTHAVHMADSAKTVTEELSMPVVMAVKPAAATSISMATNVADGVRIVGHVSNAKNTGNFRRIVDGISGKTLKEADALNPGALGDDLKGLAETYTGGRYATIQLDKPLTVYRAWAPGQSREFGAFWTLERPEGALQARIDAALLPEWGGVSGAAYRSQATQYTIIEIPPGVTIHIGEVGSQGGTWVGGKSQLLIDGGAQATWKTGGGPLK